MYVYVCVCVFVCVCVLLIIFITITRIYMFTTNIIIKLDVACLPGLKQLVLYQSIARKGLKARTDRIDAINNIIDIIR